MFLGLFVLVLGAVLFFAVDEWMATIHHEDENFIALKIHIIVVCGLGVWYYFLLTIRHAIVVATLFTIFPLVVLVCNGTCTGAFSCSGLTVCTATLFSVAVRSAHIELLFD